MFACPFNVDLNWPPQFGHWTNQTIVLFHRNNDIMKGITVVEKPIFSFDGQDVLDKYKMSNLSKISFKVSPKRMPNIKTWDVTMFRYLASSVASVWSLPSFPNGFMSSRRLRI